MKRLEDSDVWEFESTGRQFYGYTDAIGIDKDLSATFGSDGYIEVRDKDGNEEYDNDYDIISSIRPEEKRELALHMIELWKKYGGID